MPGIEKQDTENLLVTAQRLSRENSGSEAFWQIIWELHRRADRHIFAAAKDLSEDPEPRMRQLAAEILGQLGELAYVGLETLRPFTLESLPILERLLDDSDAKVVSAAIIALGHHYVSRPIASRPWLASHLATSVRLSAAKNLRVSDGSQQRDSTIRMLLQLMEDSDSAVRDWATFTLGVQSDADSPEIRRALHRRLSDEDFNARSEAMVALAQRGDRGVIPAIAAALQADTVGALAIEAAGLTGASELLELLRELTEWWDVDPELLTEAIEACSKGERRKDDRTNPDPQT